MKKFIRSIGDTLLLTIFMALALGVFIGGIVAFVGVIFLTVQLVPIILFLIYLKTESNTIQLITVLGIWVSTFIQTALVVYFLMKNNSDVYIEVDELEDDSNKSDNF